MLKVLTKFAKVIVLLTLLIIMNPHRAILIPFQLFAVCGSWVAWRLEDGCQWMADKIKWARENFWLFGSPVDEKLNKEIAELNRMVSEVDKKFKDQ